MAEGLLPLWLAVGSLCAVLGAAPLAPLLPPPPPCRCASSRATPASLLRCGRGPAAAAARRGLAGAAFAAAPIAALLPPPLPSPLLVEGCLGIAVAMAEGLLPLWLTVGTPRGRPPLAPRRPRRPLAPRRSRRCCRPRFPRCCASRAASASPFRCDRGPAAAAARCGLAWRRLWRRAARVAAAAAAAHLAAASRGLPRHRLCDGLLPPPLAVCTAGAAVGAASLTRLLAWRRLARRAAHAATAAAALLAAARRGRPRHRPCSVAKGVMLPPPLAVGAALGAAPMLPPPLSSPLLVEGCLDIAIAMAEGLLPPLLASPWARLAPPLALRCSRRCCRRRSPRRAARRGPLAPRRACCSCRRRSPRRCSSRAASTSAYAVVEGLLLLATRCGTPGAAVGASSLAPLPPPPSPRRCLSRAASASRLRWPRSCCRRCSLWARSAPPLAPQRVHRCRCCSPRRCSVRASSS